jgi:hypothetical protein
MAARTDTTTLADVAAELQAVSICTHTMENIVSDMLDFERCAARPCAPSPDAPGGLTPRAVHRPPPPAPSPNRPVPSRRKRAAGAQERGRERAGGQGPFGDACAHAHATFAPCAVPPSAP